VEGRTINIVVWTPVRIYRDGLVSALARDERILDVAAPADTAGCREALGTLDPAVLVVDATAPEAPELAAAARGIQTPVVVLGIVEREREVVAYAEAGVAAYVTLDDSLDVLLRTIHEVSAGDATCSPRIAGMLLRHVASLATERDRVTRRTVHLTRREVEILDLVGEGLSNKQIAATLSIELPTVKNHVHHILAKLGVQSRARAVALTSGSRPEVGVAIA
jgi:two-component system nitrate/nitrite response regulator NarL